MCVMSILCVVESNQFECVLVPGAKRSFFTTLRAVSTFLGGRVGEKIRRKEGREANRRQDNDDKWYTLTHEDKIMMTSGTH